MIGPSLGSKGGITSVANVYLRAGLFERWRILYLATFKDGNVLTKIATAMLAWSRYVSLLAAGKVGLLHVHTASRWSFIRKSLFVLPTALLRKPVILHLHGGEFVKFYEAELGPATRAYVRFVLRRCSIIIVLSERWRDMMQSITQDALIRVVMNPIDSMTAPGSMRSEVPHALLFLGKLEEGKGIYVLLEAVARLDARLGWRLLIGGKGDVPGVERRIQKLGIGDRVDLLGWVDGERKVELLDAATALVLPSFAEGLPMSILEAMAHGVPVIATPVGGIPDLLEDGADGILVPPGDAGKLASAITFLLKNPERARQMGAQGRKKFETRFSAHVIIPQVEAIYLDFGMRPSLGTEVEN